MKKPNIIYIHSHDTGRYIQPYGHAIETPNLQKLAEQGVLFRQAFTANPTCSPSRAALVTGEAPHSNGMLGLAHRGFSLYDYNHHILHTLRANGYHTLLSGVQHIATGEEPWKTIGYDECISGDSEPHISAAEYLETKPETPFFMAVGFGQTHRGFPDEHPLDDSRYCLPPAPLPDTPDIREDMARFKQSARDLDSRMGTVFDALEESGLAGNTFVICTTDHGIAFPRMKCNLQDSGTGIMLIMRGPGGFEGGKVIDGMVSQIDIFPTVCDLLEIEKPEWLQGKSVIPMVNGEVEEVNDAVFTEINYHAAYEPMRSVRTKRWKYIRRYDERDTPVLCNCDAGFSKTDWLEQGWQGILPEDEVLYDLMFDPNETNSLAGNPKYKDVLADMKQRLEKWMRNTGDPLLNGDVPLPETAKLNDRNDIHPQNRDTLPLGNR